MATSNLDKFVRGRLPDLPESRERYYQDEFRKLERQAATAYDKFTLTDKNIAGVSAELSVERTVRANADSALSSQITTLTTTVGTQTTSLEEVMESVDGIKGRYAVTINNNGHISGISLLSDASNGNPSSIFRIVANQFAIRNPGSSTDSIYWDGAQSKLIVNGSVALSNLVYTSTLTSPGIEFTLGSAANPIGYEAVGLFKNTSTTTDRGGVFGGSAKSNIIPACAGASTDVGGYGGGFYNFNTAGSTKITQFVGGHSSYAGMGENLSSGRQVQLATASYALYANSGKGKFYAVDGVGPFTGMHDGVTDETAMVLGDIMVDHEILDYESISSVVAAYKLSSAPNQKGVIGALSYVFDEPPEGWKVESETTLAGDNLLPSPNPVVPASCKVVHVNALGEGMINVCGENGDIAKGDLIVTSSIPGKGMKQADDIVRSYTVAKARESVSFASPTEVRQVACIYLCG